MIKPTELRIGNYVKRKIILEALNEVLYAVVDPIMIRDCAHYGQNWAFEPIPLTAEVLEACGFTMDDDEGCYKHTSGHSVNIEPDGSIAFFLYEPWGGYKIVTTLHQLQNLFYCLTGSELEVSLIGNSPITDNK